MRTIEEVIKRLEQDMDEYRESYQYDIISNNNGGSWGGGAYEEAEDILKFIKGERD